MSAFFRMACLSLLLVACGRGTGTLPLGATDRECATCHTDQYEDFAVSAHANAESSPVFTALLPRVEEAWGMAARERCQGCHAPSHVPADGPFMAESERGIACVSCHAAVGNRGSFDGRLIINLNAPLDGPFDDAEETPAHGSERRGFVSDAQSCLTCHDVRGPELFVEPTGLEHEMAVLAVDAPGCASCHMVARDEGPIADGSARLRARRSHRFVGPTPPSSASELPRYEADLRALFAGRVELTAERAGSDIAVRLANVGMGHALPTGVTFLRELRLEARFEEADGVLRTETLLVLGDRAMLGEDEVPLVTDADRIERRRIDPGQAEELLVSFRPGDRRVELRLVFSAYRADVLAALALPIELSPEVVVLSVLLDRG